MSKPTYDQIFSSLVVYRLLNGESTLPPKIQDIAAPDQVAKAVREVELGLADLKAEAVLAAAERIRTYADKTDGVRFTEHEVADAGGVMLLREYAKSIIDDAKGVTGMVDADLVSETLEAEAAAIQTAEQVIEDDREALIDVVKRNRSVVKRMSDGYPSVVFVTDETIADAILAAGFSRAAVPDAATAAREHLHAKCDCVPDLGPAHCHLCSADGSPVEWANCVAVQQVTDAPETVEVAFKTVEVERLGHLLVQLSPATPRNGAATVRRLMEEMNIKEVVS